MSKLFLVLLSIIALLAITGVNAASCGNSICESGESSISCPADCSTTASCGDGFCDQALGESSISCPADCSSTASCGDGFCDQALGESKFNCPADCSSTASCGDGFCDQALGESSASCSRDCGCNDGNPCTTDTMTAGGCSYLAVAPGTSCGFGQQCNSYGVCSSSTCRTRFCRSFESQPMRSIASTSETVSALSPFSFFNNLLDFVFE